VDHSNCLLCWSTSIERSVRSLSVVLPFHAVVKPKKLCSQKSGRVQSKQRNAPLFDLADNGLSDCGIKNIAPEASLQAGLVSVVVVEVVASRGVIEVLWRVSWIRKASDVQITF
jgi:hypothetical protein